MATRKTITPAAKLPQPELLQPRDDVRLQIADRITKGQDIQNSSITNDLELEGVRNKKKIWHEYNEELLSRIFTNEKEAKEYKSNSSISFISMGPTPFYEKVDDFRDSMKRRISNLESLQERLSSAYLPPNGWKIPWEARPAPRFGRSVCPTTSQVRQTSFQSSLQTSFASS